MWSVLHCAHLNVSKTTIARAFVFVVDVTNKQRERERQREKIIQRKMRFVQQECRAERFYQLQACFRAEPAGLLFCCVLRLGNGFGMICRKVSHLSSELCFRELTHYSENEGGTFLRFFRKKLPNHTVQNPENLLSQQSRRGQLKITLFLVLTMCFFVTFIILVDYICRLVTNFP